MSGLAKRRTEELGRELSRQFSGVCRGIEIAAMAPGDLVGETDEAYGNRVFLRHYCLHLAGPDHAHRLPRFPADARAARGFNGDIAQHAARWRDTLAAADDPERLGRRLARKTLPRRFEVRHMLDVSVPRIIAAFAETIGLWS